mgnify:CR=1 FL=1
MFRHRGGVGKSCITSSVVRSTAVRSAFDHIVWATCLQKVNVPYVQKKLYLELTGEPLSKEQSGIAEQQFSILQKAATGMKLLLVLDGETWSSCVLLAACCQSKYTRNGLCHHILFDKQTAGTQGTIVC